MPTILPLHIRKAPTIYEIATFHADTAPFKTGNRANLRTSPRTGTFYSGAGSGKYVENCGATGFEFIKPTSGSPSYRYFPGMNRNNWRNDFLFGAPTYADSGHSNYAFWQSVSSNLYSFLNSYHSGGLPSNKLIKVWVSWDKYVSLSVRDGANRRGLSYLATSPAGVCCRYAIFS